MKAPLPAYVRQNIAACLRKHAFSYSNSPTALPMYRTCICQTSHVFRKWLCFDLGVNIPPYIRSLIDETGLEHTIYIQ